MKVARQTHGSSRGLAFLETILFLPVWIALLAGFFHVARLSKNLLELRAEARDCAHRIALASCDAIPEECRSEEAPAEDSRESREVEEKGHAALRSTRVSAPTNDAVDEALGLLGGRRTLVTREKETRGPGPFGPKSSKLSAVVRMPCAPKLKAPENSARGTLELIGGGF